MKKRLLGIVGACLMAGAVQADAPVQVRDSAPERYTVVRGDTLWDISSRYLSDPWRWPEVWEINPQVQNPHLIYPGDVLLLCQIKGRAVVAVDHGRWLCRGRGSALPQASLHRLSVAQGVTRSCIRRRECKPLSLAIPAIPLQEIQRYLNGSRVVTKAELDKAPYMCWPARKAALSAERATAFMSATRVQLAGI
jgi:hypothetical protein